MQIRYTHKLSMHKADLSQANFLKFETVMHHTLDIKSKLLLSNKISCASYF